MEKEDVKGIRKKLKLNRNEFAKLIGVSSWTVKAWELGTREPNSINRKKIDSSCKKS